MVNPKAPLDIPSVLVVDDDPVSRLVSSHVLEAGGLNVLQATSAREARQFLSGASTSVEVIVCDHLMPDETGLDLLADLRRSPGPQPQFLLLTGVANEEELDDSRTALADGFLTKPVQSSELLTAVRGALEHGRQLTPRS